jgi:multiple sugar transport system permease protein
MGPSRLERVLALLVTVLLLLIIFLPIAWMVISSVSPREELLATPPHWIPQRLDLSDYQDILVPGEQASDVALTFRTALFNSIQVASLGAIIGLLLAIPAAYALSRIPMPGGRVTMTAILATRMLPAIATVIPLYLMAATLGLMDTKAVLVILYLSFVLPFNVWILTGFFSTIPREIEEAARIDGAGRLRVLRSVILPLSRPGIAATAIYSFLLAWDEFFFPLIFTSTREAKMVPVAISEFTGRHAVDFGAMATGGVLAAIPVVIVALVFNRLIVSGLTAGAVKE